MNNYGYNYRPHDPPPPYPQSTGRADEDFQVTSRAVRHEVTSATGELDRESAEPPPPYYAVVPPCILGDARIVAPTGSQRRELEGTVISQPDYSRESYKCHSVLACFVLWSGNCVFGLVAYILAGLLTSHFEVENHGAVQYIMAPRGCGLGSTTYYTAKGIPQQKSESGKKETTVLLWRTFSKIQNCKT
jgi:hypothetical protein